MDTAKKIIAFHGGDKLQVLNRAIDSFNVKARELESTYLHLDNQVKQLNKALEEKNRELLKNLQEKEEVKNFLSSILESLPSGVVVTDLSGKLLMHNSAVQKITGANLSRMTSARFKDWVKKLQLTDGAFRNASQVHCLETRYQRKKADIRSLSIIQSPVIGTHGDTIGVLFIIQDQTRLKALEEQSERDKRLKAMGEMAIRIAHEVRNPLGSIELLASILRSELEDRSDLERMAGRIVTEVKSLNNSISNLLLFTRPQQPFLHELNLSEFLEEFVDFIRPVVSKNGVELTCKKPGAPLFLNGDRDLLKQVFLNLTLNALQALPDSGAITIGLRSFTDEHTRQSAWVEVSFSDSGEGIAPDAISKIFNPFYTTKDKGTGLGLAIVHNIIESHRGTIEVRSRLKKGTTFYITLPASRAGKKKRARQQDPGQ